MGCDEEFPKTFVAVRLQLAISHQTGAIKASPCKEEVFFSKNEARGISEHDAVLATWHIRSEMKRKTSF
jgi:hypothetical protein